MAVNFREKQKSYVLAIIIYVIVSAGILLYLIWPSSAGQNLAGYLKVILGLVAVLNLLMFWWFYYLEINITDHQLIFGFGLFKRSVALNSISNIKIMDYDKKNFKSYGIRLGKDKTIGFIAQNSRGVYFSSAGQNFFITSNNPEEIINKLKVRS